MEYINYWVELYNSTPATAFWFGIVFAAAVLAYGLYLAKAAWKGTGICELGPIRALATFTAVGFCCLGLGFFVVEPLETIQRNQTTKAIVYNNEECDLVDCQSTYVSIQGRTTGNRYELRRVLDVTSDWSIKSPTQVECYNDTMLVTCTYCINGIEKQVTYPLTHKLIVMHDEPQPRPDWLYNWEKPENPSWNMAFRF